MLVLSRKRNAEIVIGEDISIVIVAIHGEKPCLGIGGPAEVSVRRREVNEAIERADRNDADRRTTIRWDC